MLKSVFESARQRIVEINQEDTDAVGGSEAVCDKHLNLESKNIFISMDLTYNDYSFVDLDVKHLPLSH